MTNLLVGNFGFSVALFLSVWVISIAIKDVGIVDIAWGPSLALMGFLTWMRVEGAEPRATLLMVLVGLWGLRLAGYLALRNLGHDEDFRYARMREKAGGDRPFAIKSLYTVFALQCLISFFVSLPVQIGQIGSSSFLGSGSGALGVLAYLGVLLFAIGLFFETVGDIQLRRFKSDPANQGKLMDRGLWSWTRHPNYFGDAAVWFGLSLIAFESEFGIATILSPFLMLYFLYVQSGKGLLERLMARRYPEFDEYKRRVSGFIPRPPRA